MAEEGTSQGRLPGSRLIAYRAFPSGCTVSTQNFPHALRRNINVSSVRNTRARLAWMRLFLSEHFCLVLHARENFVRYSVMGIWVVGSL
jgi:hypothetical protein